jgi:hypothetical protein
MTYPPDGAAAPRSPRDASWVIDKFRSRWPWWAALVLVAVFLAGWMVFIVRIYAAPLRTYRVLHPQTIRFR